MLRDVHSELQTILGDAFTLERELGGGGMSRVFVARENALDRRVVVKILPPELAASISSERFRREIAVAATLHHPHIVPLLSASASGDLLFYTMPFVPGESLKDRLRTGGPLPVSSAVRIAEEVAAALASAHRQGVVHRDIKPGNILLAEDGEALVTDFGIARALERATHGRNRIAANGSTQLTEIGLPIGTPGYMSPEQAAGRSDLDERSDVYALGCVLFEMLTGATPFTGARDELIARRITEDAPSLRSVQPDAPPALERILAKALARRPEDRYANATDFQRALTDTASSASATTRWSRRARFAVGSLATAALLSVLAYWARSRGAPVDYDPDLLAVLPFDVLSRDPRLASTGEDLSTVLSMNFDGAGPLHSAPNPMLRARRDGPRGGPADVARSTRARFVVTGVVLPLGGGRDSTRVTATVYDAARGGPLDQVAMEARDLEGDLARVSDTLTYAILRVLARERPIGAARRVPLGSAVSFPVFRAFLDGERQLRRANWESARVAYERAIAADTTLAMAYSRLSLVLGWRRIAGDSLARAAALRAGTLSRGLGPHDSLLVTADSLSASLDDPKTQQRWWPRAERLLETRRLAAERYPDDPIAWYLLGEARMHYGGPLGVTEAETKDAFDHAIALDSAFSPAYAHQIELALEMGGDTAARPYVSAYLALRPTDTKAVGAHLVAAFLGPGGVGSAESRALLDTASADALFNAWISVRRWADSAEVATKLLRLLMTGKRRASYAAFVDPAATRIRLAAQLAYRGDLREAWATSAKDDPRLLAELAILGTAPASDVDARFARWLRDAPDSAVWGLPWWASRGDTMRLTHAVARYKARSVHGDAASRLLARYAVAAGRAYLALVARDTAEALRRLDAVPLEGCNACYFRWLTEAELRVARGDSTGAARVLRRWYTFPSPPYPSEARWAELRARIISSGSPNPTRTRH